MCAKAKSKSETKARGLSLQESLHEREPGVKEKPLAKEEEDKITLKKCKIKEQPLSFADSNSEKVTEEKGNPVVKDEEDKRFPDYGPINIENYRAFLEKSKKEFIKKWSQPLVHAETLEDFDQLVGLASGSFGTVVLIKHKESGEFYAMKALEKADIMRSKSLERSRNEKNITKCLKFPFTIYLKYFFIDHVYIYLVMPYVPGGELFHHLSNVKKLSEGHAKFYASQVILALEYLHHLDIIYRDLKAENVLIDRDGFVKVIDFGLSKPLIKGRTYTICGTVDYLAPEVILQKGYGKAVDWWAVGVFLFELVAGRLPFQGRDELHVFDKVVNLKYKTPWGFSKELKDLVKKILQRDLSKRFGNLKAGVEDIKNHQWFKELNWLAVLNRRVTPPFIPKYATEGATDNFEGPGHLYYVGGFEPLRKAKSDEYPEEFSNF